MISKGNIFLFKASILFIALVLSIYLPFVIYNNISNKVKYELNGDIKEYLSVNTEYKDKGINFYINGEKAKNKKYKLNINNNIDEKVLGTYKVKYSIDYKNHTYNLEREIQVIDNEKPIINVNKNQIENNTCSIPSQFEGFEYIAIDNYDGVITNKVVETKTETNLNLYVKDSSNNETSIDIPIIYTNNSTPVVKINNKKIIYIEEGSQYEEYGAYITDSCGHKLDGEVRISGSVDTSKIGSNTITYEFDYNGSIIKNERYVYVYQKNISNNINSGSDKVVYLTFDDGPGQYTEQLLNILDKYNVKATFFVTAQFSKYIPLISEESKRGHKVAVHTLTHKWSIYQSVETYLKDFNDMNNLINDYTGYKTNIFRFPGGSSNTISKSYSKGVVSAIASQMTNDGYVYFDWNVDSGDASGKNRDQIYNNVTKGIAKQPSSVVLMHDIKINTINAIEDIIIYALNNGYTFKILDEYAPTVHHSINN